MWVISYNQQKLKLYSETSIKNFTKRLTCKKILNYIYWKIEKQSSSKSIQNFQLEGKKIGIYFFRNISLFSYKLAGFQKHKSCKLHSYHFAGCNFAYFLFILPFDNACFYIHQFQSEFIIQVFYSSCHFFDGG